MSAHTPEKILYRASYVTPEGEDESFLRIAEDDRIVADLTSADLYNFVLLVPTLYIRILRHGDEDEVDRLQSSIAVANLLRKLMAFVLAMMTDEKRTLDNCILVLPDDPGDLK